MQKQLEFDIVPREIYVVVDVETTGLSFKEGARIIEVGAVRVEDSRITDQYTALVNPGKRIPEKIVSITGITSEMLLDAPTFEEIAEVLYAFIGDNYMVAHNFPFDYSFLKGEFELVGKALPPRGICTLSLSRKLLNLQRNNLDSLAHYFNVRFDEGRHRALGDALATAEIFLKMKKMLLGDNPGIDFVTYYKKLM